MEHNYKQQELSFLTAKNIKAGVHTKHLLTWQQLIARYFTDTHIETRENRDCADVGFFIPWDMINPDGSEGVFSFQKKDNLSYSRCTPNMRGTQILVLDIDNKPVSEN